MFNPKPASGQLTEAELSSIVNEAMENIQRQKPGLSKDTFKQEVRHEAAVIIDLKHHFDAPYNRYWCEVDQIIDQIITKEETP